MDIRGPLLHLPGDLCPGRPDICALYIRREGAVRKRSKFYHSTDYSEWKVMDFWL